MNPDPEIKRGCPPLWPAMVGITEARTGVDSTSNTTESKPSQSTAFTLTAIASLEPAKDFGPEQRIDVYDMKMARVARSRPNLQYIPSEEKLDPNTVTEFCLKGCPDCGTMLSTTGLDTKRNGADARDFSSSTVSAIFCGADAGDVHKARSD